MLRDESNDNHYKYKIRKVLGRISRAIVQTLPTNDVGTFHSHPRKGRRVLWTTTNADSWRTIINQRAQH